MKETFGEYIHRLRTDANMTLTKLAAALDIDQSTLSKMENGKRNVPEEILPKLASVFDIKAEDVEQEYYSTKIAEMISPKANYDTVLKLAQEKVEYLKTKDTKRLDEDKANKMTYKLEKHYINVCNWRSVSLFDNELEDIVEIDFSPKSYTVNDKIDEIIGSKIQALGFFSGAGGLDIGTQLAGVKVISSLDFDKDSVATMMANQYFGHAKHHLKDIRETKARDFSVIIKENNPEKLILVGGPPCQPFSKAGYWVTHENRLGNEDPRNMIGQYMRIIQELKPDGFLLENVESILHPKNMQAVIDLETSISNLGYHLIRFKVNAIDFGVPQKRKRVFFFASRKKIDFPPVHTHGNDEDRLSNPSLHPYEKVIDWIGQYDIAEYFEKDELTINKTYYTELTDVPPGKNYIALTSREGYPNPKFEANKRFWSFLLKLDPLQPSWTIAAQPGPWVGPFHWKNRRLRVPEIAAIQTFPKDYQFAGNRRSIQKQVGNAVPALLGKSMIEHLIKFI